jgi:hypothetical protein
MSILQKQALSVERMLLLFVIQQPAEFYGGTEDFVSKVTWPKSVAYDNARAMFMHGLYIQGWGMG